MEWLHHRSDLPMTDPVFVTGRKKVTFDAGMLFQCYFCSCNRMVLQTPTLHQIQVLLSIASDTDDLRIERNAYCTLGCMTHELLISQDGMPFNRSSQYAPKSLLNL
jgi:hypothetical protein